jgi:alpha-tubulin suppressor-like RCC1 family protein
VCNALFSLAACGIDDRVVGVSLSETFDQPSLPGSEGAGSNPDSGAMAPTSQAATATTRESETPNSVQVIAPVNAPAPPDDDASEATSPSEPVPREPVPSEPVPSEPVPSEPVPSEPVYVSPCVTNNGGCGDPALFSCRDSGNASPSCLLRAEQVVAVANHMCARLSDGTVRCWGQNTFGQLGNGTKEDAFAPTPVTGLTGVQFLAMGNVHGCALLLDGTVQCWGNNEEGQLGDGTTVERLTPVLVRGLSGARALTSSLFHTCALLSNGTVQCWGINQYGELGDGTTEVRSSPVTVPGLSGVKALAGGGAQGHMCAILSNDTLQCWGQNFEGQLGDGTTNLRTTLVSVPGLGGVQSVTVGAYHTCAVPLDGTVRCWGFNTWGQLGNGTTTDNLSLVTVPGLRNVQLVAAGQAQTCALLPDETVQCWGDTRLQSGATTDSLTPAPVPGLNGVRAVTVGAYQICALLSDQTVQCGAASGVMSPIVR